MVMLDYITRRTQLVRFKSMTISRGEHYAEYKGNDRMGSCRDYALSRTDFYFNDTTSGSSVMRIRFQ